ncbi:MAG TPA: hypothetical protein VF065_03560 [Ilumatobacter sp.]
MFAHSRDITRSRDERRHKMLRTAVVLSAVGVLTGATTAAGAPLEQGRFHDSGSELLEDFCGIDVVHTWDVSGSFLGVTLGSDGLVHFRDSVRGSNAWTNTETGRSYTGLFTTASHDLEVTDNGDGTLTIMIQGSGSERWYDGDGTLVLRNPGLTRWEILVDHAGTPSDPFDDEFIEFLGDVKGSTGRNDTEGHDFCEDLLLYTA